jgi:hypothetical protein
MPYSPIHLQPLTEHLAYHRSEYRFWVPDIQHHIFNLAYDGYLCACPAVRGKDAPPSCVLDIGTGSGIWAVDFGALVTWSSFFPFFLFFFVLFLFRSDAQADSRRAS